MPQVVLSCPRAYDLVSAEYVWHVCNMTRETNSETETQHILAIRYYRTNVNQQRFLTAPFTPRSDALAKNKEHERHRDQRRREESKDTRAPGHADVMV